MEIPQGPLNWENDENTLLLNPRMPEEIRVLFESAWNRWVRTGFRGHVGIATSGSSGEGFGKLTLLSRSALLKSAEAVNTRLDSSSDDVWMKTLPSFHVGGLGILARAHLSGARVYESRQGSWNESAFMDELNVSGATLLSLVPTQLFDLIKAERRPSPALRAVIVGGGRLDRSLYERAIELGWPVLPSYGMTECASQVATAKAPGDPRLYPLDHVQLDLDDEGRLMIRSEALLTGAITITREGGEFHDPKIRGWYASEDRVRLSSDGVVTVLGRTQDFVKIGGEGVTLSRLEETLNSIRLSSECRSDVALVAVPDARLGSVIALVAAGDGPDVNELIDSFNRVVMPYERVRHVFHLPVLPRSNLGKLLRGRVLAAIGFQSIPNQ